jgi:hypothetical protein
VWVFVWARVCLGVCPCAYVCACVFNCFYVTRLIVSKRMHAHACVSNVRACARVWYVRIHSWLTIHSHTHKYIHIQICAHYRVRETVTWGCNTWSCTHPWRKNWSKKFTRHFWSLSWKDSRWPGGVVSNAHWYYLSWTWIWYALIWFQAAQA